MVTILFCSVSPLRRWVGVSNHGFCASKKQWGFSNFISLSELNEVVAGYIKDDAITMKVEIFKMDVIIEAELNEAEKGSIKDGAMPQCMIPSLGDLLTSQRRITPLV